MPPVPCWSCDPRSANLFRPHKWIKRKNVVNTLLEPDLPRFLNGATGRKELAKILYAEDNAALRLVTARMLTRTGYAVTSVEDGLQAWEALQSDKYDILITDNDMPGL